MVIKTTLSHNNKWYVKQNIIIKLFIVALVTLVAGLYLQSYVALAWIIIAMNMWCIKESWRNNSLLIISLFITYCNFSIVRYFWTAPDTVGQVFNYGWFRQFDETMALGLYILFVFNAILFIFFPNCIKQEKNEQVFRVRNNNSSNIMSLAIIALIGLITVWKIMLLLRTGEYTESAIYEYMTILFIVAYYHASDNRNVSFVISALIILNILFVFINGDRGAAINFALVLYASIFQNKIPKKVFFIGLIAGIVGLNAIGMWRGMYAFDISIFVRSIGNMISKGLTLDTAFAAEAAGLAILMFSGDVVFSERIHYFIKYIEYIFIGSKVGTDANLSKLSYYAYPHHNGGGVLPYYAHFYLGMIGVVLLALLLVKYLSIIAKTNRNTSGIKKCIAVYIFATVTNWYLYSPAPLFRGMLILFIVYCFSRIFGSMRLKK